MGLADRIRTKQAAKAFVESGNLKTAEVLIKQTSERTTAKIQPSTLKDPPTSYIRTMPTGFRNRHVYQDSDH